MFIRKIALQNFRSHTETVLDCAKLTVVRGANAVGKSSIEQALEITLGGRTESTTDDGKGSKGLIRAGQKKAGIKIAVSDGEEERVIQCALNDTARNIIVTKPGDDQWNGGAKWAGWLQQNRDAFSCLINNRYFVDLPDAQQKDVLASIVLPKTYEWPEWVKPMANGLGLKINWQLTPFEIITVGYEQAYKARTDINRDVKNHKIPEGSVELADEYEAIREKLGARRAELETALREKTERESAQTGAAALLDAAIRRRDEARVRLSREEQEVTALDGKLLSKAKLKEKEGEGKKAGRAAELDVAIVATEADYQASKKHIEELNSFSNQPTCPTCKSPITSELVEALAKPLVEKSNVFSNNLRGMTDERKKLGNPQEALRDIEVHRQAERDMEKAKGRAKDESVIIADAEAKIFELETAKRPVFQDQAAEDHIADLRAKIEKGGQVLAIAKTAAELAERIKTAQQGKEALEKKQADAEKLVAYFGPEGVQSELLAASVGAFEVSMNGVLEEWGYHCELSIEPYSLTVSMREGDSEYKLPLRALSKSQRYRFSTAFQVALAIATGFGFVVVDEADIYDKAGRSALFSALNTEELDQAIILSTDERDTIPNVEGALFYMLSNAAGLGELPKTTVQRLKA